MLKILSNNLRVSARDISVTILNKIMKSKWLLQLGQPFSIGFLTHSKQTLSVLSFFLNMCTKRWMLMMHAIGPIRKIKSLISSKYLSLMHRKASVIVGYEISICIRYWLQFGLYQVALAIQLKSMFYPTSYRDFFINLPNRKDPIYRRMENRGSTKNVVIDCSQQPPVMKSIISWYVMTSEDVFGATFTNRSLIKKMVGLSCSANSSRPYVYPIK